MEHKSRMNKWAEIFRFSTSTTGMVYLNSLLNCREINISEPAHHKKHLVCFLRARMSPHSPESIVKMFRGHKKLFRVFWENQEELKN